MTAWATILVPAGGVLLGGVITGGAAIWGQLIVQGATYKRERAARDHGLRIKRYEIDRDTLLQLQEAINSHFIAWTEIDAFRNTETPIERELSLRYASARMAVISLANRVLDPNVRESSKYYLETTSEYASGSSKKSSPSTAASRTHDAIGRALTRDPIDISTSIDN